MSKLITASVLALLSIAVTGMAATAPERTINLNRPGALEALQQSNPTHYEKIRKITEGVLQKPDADVPRWIQTTVDARDVNYTPVLLTSAPPKKRLSFVLDDTRYEAVVTLTTMGGGIVPLK